MNAYRATIDVMRRHIQPKGLLPLVGLSLAALGVVYGDIGTSPLYAIKEIFFGPAHETITAPHVIGAISLVLWSLTLIVGIKYVLFVLRADNEGEGGVFSLYGLLQNVPTKTVAIVATLLLLSAGFLLGEGVITPAISVLSAVEGIGVISSVFNPYIIPLTLIILTGLFCVQQFGTAKIGKVFGPIILIWFIAIGVMGLLSIIATPSILYALNPLAGIGFLFENSITTNLLIMGSVVLVITGGEALFADMGHFGKLPIRISWFSVVFPALILNYLGQGAFLLSGNPVIQENIFFSMFPQWSLVPMVILATMATIIASQALITGAFSLVTQAIQLGVLPYLNVKHTHEHHEGQIYVPFVNWALFAATVTLVLLFRTSANLAAAYGFAVSSVMFVTTLAMICVSYYLWKWPLLKSLALFIPIGTLELFFIAANALKIPQGGYIPLGIGIAILIIMSTWKWGRKFVRKTYADYPTMTIADLITLKQNEKMQLPRSIVFMTPTSVTQPEDKLPFLKQLFWERYGMLPRHMLFVTVAFQKKPFIDDERYVITKLYETPEKGSIAAVKINFGFMEEPDVEAVLEGLAAHHEIHIAEHPREWLVHVVHERIYLRHAKNMLRKLRFMLYQFMARNSKTADQYFGLGRDVRLSVEVVPVWVSE